MNHFERLEQECLDRLKVVYHEYLAALFKNSGKYYFSDSEKKELIDQVDPLIEEIEDTIAEMNADVDEDTPFYKLSRFDFTKSKRKELCDKIRSLNYKINRILIEMAIQYHKNAEAPDRTVYDLQDMDEVDVLPDTIKYYHNADLPCLTPDQRRNFKILFERLNDEYMEIVTLQRYEIESEDALPGLHEEFRLNLGHFEVKFDQKITDFRVGLGISDADWETCTRHL